MKEPERLAARVTQLEELLTHLQQTVQDLNDVILAQHRRLDEFERRATLAAREVQNLADAITEQRTLEDDKPPHY